MLKYFVSLLSFFFFANVIFAQSNAIVIHGRVTDVHGKAIPFCGIQNLSFHSGTTADSNGVYSFSTNAPATLRVSALGFSPQQKHIAAGSDSLELNFVLESNSLQLNEVSIHSKYEPEVLTEEPNLADFEFRDGHIWMLYNFKRKDRIAVTDTSGKLIVQSWLYNRAGDLHKTEHGFVYSITEDSAFVYQFDKKNHFSSFSVGIDTFRSAILTIAAYQEPCYYYMTDTAARTLITYYFVNTAKDTTGILWSNFNVQAYLDNQQVYQNINALIASMGGGGEGAAGMNEGLNQRMLTANHIRNNELLIKSSYCPMKIVRDSIYIFNFDVDTAYVFDRENRLVRKMFMQFDLYGRKYMYKKMVVDEEKQQCYFEYSVMGITHIDQISLDNGTTENTQVIDRFPFVEKLRISNGFAYFCVFDAGTGKRKLARQKIG